MGLSTPQLNKNSPRVFVGTTTKEDFALSSPASFYTNVQIVLETTQFLDVGNPITNPIIQNQVQDEVLPHQEKNRSLEIVTPVSSKALSLWLSGYDKDEANFLVSGFDKGFSVGYMGPHRERTSHNLKSCEDFPEVVKQKIAKEVEQNRIAGPFVTPPLPCLQISPIGVVPKKESGSYRLIHHLSYPPGDSINSYIPDIMKTVSYATIDDAIHIITSLGSSCYMAKCDIANAYRNLPICPEDHSLLGFKWQGNFYYDKCLPMGCSSSCSIFEKFSTALQWIAQKKLHIPHMVHILDDFLFIGKSENICNSSLDLFLKLCASLGVPIKPEKTVHASTNIIFLGIELDTMHMEARLPIEKIEKVTLLLQSLGNKKKVTLRELQSVLGLLNFACSVVLPGRAFLRRLIDLTKGKSKPYHKIRLNKESRLDIQAWLQFVSSFNGKNLLLDQIWLSSEHLHFYTDSAGSLGYGAIFDTKWFYGSWPKALACQDITVKEMFPIVLALETWKEDLKNKCLVLHSDNLAVVHVINKQSSKDKMLMCLVRRLVVTCLKENILVRAEHIPGNCNVLADLLSRFQIEKFREAAPFMDRHPSRVNPSLLHL